MVRREKIRKFIYFQVISSVNKAIISCFKNSKIHEKKFQSKIIFRYKWFQSPSTFGTFFQEYISVKFGYTIQWISWTNVQTVHILGDNKSETAVDDLFVKNGNLSTFQNVFLNWRKKNLKKFYGF